jgi:uncharacterized protein (DUF362 family)
MQKVSVLRSEGDVRKTVKNSIDLVGGLDVREGMNIIIKPNICNSRNPGGMVNTDLRVIKAVIDLIREKDCEITIVESDNISGTADKRLQESGYLTKFEEWDVNFINLSNDSYREYSIAGTNLRLPLTVLDADYFINIPKIKTCAHTLVTLGIKNLYGVFQRKKKDRLHKYLDSVLTFLAEKVRTDLIVVDGLTCMEGNGPVIGNPICLEIIVSGKNIVSVDSTCSRIMGYDPLLIPHIEKSSAKGIGPIKIEDIEIVGDDIDEIKTFFTPPYSLRANLRSLKSIRDIYFP